MFCFPSNLTINEDKKNHFIQGSFFPICLNLLVLGYCFSVREATNEREGAEMKEFVK